MGENCLALGLVGNGPMLGVGHRLLKIITHVAYRKEGMVYHDAAIYGVCRPTEHIGRMSFGCAFLLHTFERIRGKNRICLCAFAGIEEAFAETSLKLHGVASFFRLLGQDDDIGNHLLHTPSAAVGKHPDVADDLVLRVIIGELLFELHINGVQELRHLFAFVALLAFLGGDDGLLKGDRLLNEGYYGYAV